MTLLCSCKEPLAFRRGGVVVTVRCGRCGGRVIAIGARPEDARPMPVPRAPTGTFEAMGNLYAMQQERAAAPPGARQWHLYGDSRHCTCFDCVMRRGTRRSVLG